MKEYVLVPREEYDNFIVLRAFADRAAKGSPSPEPF